MDHYKPCVANLASLCTPSLTVKEVNSARLNKDQELVLKVYGNLLVIKLLSKYNFKMTILFKWNAPAQVENVTPTMHGLLNKKITVKIWDPSYKLLAGRTQWSPKRHRILSLHLVSHHNYMGKPHCLKTAHASTTGHRESNCKTTRKLKPCWLGFIVSADVMWAAGGQKTAMVLPSLAPACCGPDLLGKLHHGAMVALG